MDDQRIPDERVDALINEYGSVRLSMDGNAGCALLGPDLMEGEVCFVEVGPHLKIKGETASSPERRAMAQAMRKMRERCGRSVPYHFA
jgi:hypothetical protein